MKAKWIVKKEDDGLWWLYLSNNYGGTAKTKVTWAYTFEIAQSWFPKYMRKFMEE